jgi:hypothetical protein
MMHRSQVTFGTPMTPGVNRRRRVAAPRLATPRTLAGAGAALVLALVFLMPFAVRPIDTPAYYLGLALFLLTLVPVVTRLMAGDLDVFEPIVPISLLTGLAFGIRAMYLVYDPTSFSTWLARVSFDDFIGRALMMALAAYCALLVGYYFVAAPVVRLLRDKPYVPRRTWPLKPNAAKILALIALGVVATGVRLRMGETAAATGSNEVTSATFVVGVLSTLAQYVACALALHIAAGDDRRWLRSVLWLGVLPLAALQALVFGGKTPILMALYAVMAARHYAKRRLSVPLLAAGVVLAVLVVFPTVNAFRVPTDRALAAGSAEPTIDEFASRVAEIPSLFAGMGVSEYARFAAESVLGRANGVDALAVIMKYGDAVQLGNPTAYWQIPLYAFVPRALWPDKPVILTGTEFARLFVTPSEEGLREFPSIGVFHVGDLYASFGGSGVLIGMCVFGLLLRVVYQVFDPVRSPDLGMKFVYIVLLWSIVNGFESDIPTIYGNLLKSLLIWILIKMWLNGRAPGRATGFSPSGLRRSVVMSPPRTGYATATAPR